MNPIIKTASALAIAAIVAGCATSPDQISASYVSPTAYQGQTCQQLYAEAVRLNGEITKASAAQQAAASGDAAKMGVALVLFAPAALFISGDKTSAADLARLKGEGDAVRNEYVRKGC